MKDYIMQLNTAYDENYDGDGPIEIGKIVHKRTQEDVMYLVYDRSDHEKARYRFHVDIYEADDRDNYPVVTMDDYFRKLYYQKSWLFEALAMHELGHFLFGHLAPDHYKGMTNDAVMKLRQRYIERGDVMPEESQADAFAVKQCGKRAVRDAIDILIKRRKERGDIGMHLAIKEFEVRKRKIQKL